MQSCQEEFPSTTMLFRKSSTFGKVKGISEKPSYSSKQKQNHEEQRGRSMFTRARAAVSVVAYTSRLAANKSQDWAIKDLVYGRKTTCCWQLIVSSSSSQTPVLSCIEKRPVASTKREEQLSTLGTLQQPVLVCVQQWNHHKHDNWRETSLLWLLLASLSLSVKTTRLRMHITKSLSSRAAPMWKQTCSVLKQPLVYRRFFCLCVLTWKGEKARESADLFRKVDKTPNTAQRLQRANRHLTKAPIVQAHGQ